MSGPRRLTHGIIGLGGAGRAHHARFWKTRRIERIVGYDHKKRDYPGIETIYDFDAFLSTVDTVSICTPDRDHLGTIVKCLEAGKHVLVEKPMVASLAEGLELAGTLERLGRQVFSVHHQMRYVPAFYAARRLIESGELGEVFYIEANYWHDMRERSTMYDDWRMAQGSGGQSVIFAHGCHPYDLLMWLLDDYPVEHKTFVNHKGFKEYPQAYTAATTVFKFPSGVIAKSHVNNCCVFPQLNNLAVLGDRGTYIDGILYKDGGFERVADFFPPRSYLSEPPRSYLRPAVNYLRDPGAVLHLAARGAQHALLRYFAGRREWRQYPLTVYNHELACDRVVENFIDAVTQDAPVLVGYHDALRVIRLCEEVERDATVDAGLMRHHSAGPSSP